MNTSSIQECLLCPFTFEDETLVAVVLRRGRHVLLFTLLRDLIASISTSKEGTSSLSRELHVPVRVIDGQEGALLARKVILAEANGLPHVQL